MYAYDIIAYAYNADIHCPYCAHEDGMDEEEAEDGEGNPVHPIFVDNAYDAIGYSCGSCHQFCGPDLEWHENPKEFRWAKCVKCGTQEPFDKTDSENRKLALLNKLNCSNCLGRLHF